MKKDVFCFTEDLQFCCGIDEIGSFSFNKNDDMWFGGRVPIQSIEKSGSGFYVAAFCKQAYEELKTHFILLYQSPVRRNRRTGNKLFMCVYLEKNRSDK